MRYLPEKNCSWVVRRMLCVLLVLLLFLLPEFSSGSDGRQLIEGSMVQSMLKEGSALWLIDVRGSKAYHAEHIEGSVNIPSDFLKYKKFPSNKKLIVVDDSLGQRMAREAAEMLVKSGHDKIYVLDGGIALWRFEGFPVVGKRPVVSGVTGDELKWALENKIPLKIFDLTGVQGREDKISSSEHVPGKDTSEKIEKLKGLLKKNEGKDLSGMLKKPRAIVLVFPASEDVERLTENMHLDTKDDVRYLVGGYETFMAKKDGQARARTCPTCPGK